MPSEKLAANLHLDVQVTRRKRWHHVEFPGEGIVFSSAKATDCWKHIIDHEYSSVHLSTPAGDYWIDIVAYFAENGPREIDQTPVDLLKESD